MAAEQTIIIMTTVNRQAIFRQKKATPPAHPRHTSLLLPLLPSGPGGVRREMLRGYQRSHQTQSIRITPTDCNRLYKKSVIDGYECPYRFKLQPVKNR